MIIAGTLDDMLSFYFGWDSNYDLDVPADSITTLTYMIKYHVTRCSHEST